jgi:hypothetical protein
VQYPEGSVLSDEEEDDPDEGLIQSEPVKQLKRQPTEDTTIDSTVTKRPAEESTGGWLANSGLNETQQMKLFRLMGGKTKEDMELLNKRSCTFNYDEVTHHAEEDFSKGIKKRMGNQLKGLGKR